MSDNELEIEEDPGIEIDNAASPKAIRKKAQKAKDAAEENRDFWRKITSDAVGRRVLWDVFASAGVFEERFSCGPNGFPQPEATWFKAGEQSFGHRLYLSIARIDRAGILQMHAENDQNFAEPPVVRKTRSDP